MYAVSGEMVRLSFGSMLMNVLTGNPGYLISLEDMLTGHDGI